MILVLFIDLYTHFHIKASGVGPYTIFKTTVSSIIAQDKSTAKYRDRW